MWDFLLKRKCLLDEMYVLCSVPFLSAWLFFVLFFDCMMTSGAITAILQADGLCD
jgi:hypothetical protein